MGFKTKLVTSIMSVVACISVMVLGILAILTSQITFQNNETIVMENIKGNLYGYRFGAGAFDIYNTKTSGELEPVLLYVDGAVADEKNLSNYLSNVGFGTEEQFMEYILVFELSEDATNDVWVTLEDASITTNAHTARYQYSFQETEPEDWDSTEEIDGTIAVTKENRHLWIRASLTAGTTDDYATRGIPGPGTWTFTFSFKGANA